MSCLFLQGQLDADHLKKVINYLNGTYPGLTNFLHYFVSEENNQKGALETLIIGMEHLIQGANSSLKNKLVNKPSKLVKSIDRYGTFPREAEKEGSNHFLRTGDFVKY